MRCPHAVALILLVLLFFVGGAIAGAYAAEAYSVFNRSDCDSRNNSAYSHCSSALSQQLPLQKTVKFTGNKKHCPGLKNPGQI